jgi:hypothetical protein
VNRPVTQTLTARQRGSLPAAGGGACLRAGSEGWYLWRVSFEEVRVRVRVRARVRVRVRLGRGTSGESHSKRPSR